MPSASSLRELAASVLMVGFEGTRPNSALSERMRRLRPGGMIVFARNVDGPPERVHELVASLTEAIDADLPLLVALDQEGGRVARLREGATSVPSMMALAASGDADLAERVGYVLGYDVSRAGGNVNFAPVLDLALQPENTVIGARAFSDDPAIAASFGMAVARGIARAGVVPTYKHFPGHGSTAVDSHLALPVIDVPVATFRARDLAPFAQALSAGADAIMCAHIVVRSIDAERPATIAPAVLTTLLREYLRFDGVCFTDCLEMGAIAGGVGTARAAVLALAAGADCPLISHTYELAQAAIQQIVAALEDGSLPLSRLEQAAERLRRLRAKVGRGVAPLPFGVAAQEAARRSITLLRGDPHVRLGGCVLISFDGSTAEGVEGVVEAHSYLHDALSAREIAVRSVTFPLDAAPEDVPNFPAIEDPRATRPVVVVRRAHLHPGQPAIVARILAQRPDAIVVSAREPFDVPLFDEASTLLCTYSDDAVSMEALADVLVGTVAPQGHLPIRRPSFADDRG